MPFLSPFGWRLFITFSLLASLMVTAIGMIGFIQSRQSVLKRAQRQVSLVGQDRSHELSNWILERKREISLLSQLPDVVRIFDRYGEVHTINRQDSLRLADIFDLVHLTFSDYGPCGIMSFDGLPLVHVSNSDCQTDNPLLQAALQQALSTYEPVLSALYLSSSNEPVFWLVQAISDQFGAAQAALVFSILAEKTIHPILADRAGLGTSGETYLTTREGLLLTPFRNDTTRQQLYKKNARIERSSDSYINYAGEEVIGCDIELPDLGWVVSAELSLVEALEPIKKIIRQLILVGLLSIFVILIISAYISRRLTIPLNHLLQASRSISMGQFDLAIPQTGSDEVGALSRQFQIMASSLQRSREELEVSTRRLVHAEKLALIGKLVASIVHEMRNPLSAIKMNLRILEKKAVLDKSGETHLGIAKEQSGRLEKMLNELLEYSKPVQAQFTTVNLKALLLQTKIEFNAQMAEKSISIKASFPDLPFEVYSDPDLLARVFDNLISNAIAAAPAESTIDVTLDEKDNGLTVTVKDAGKGMSQKVLEQIFEPFFTTRGDGVGLGLSNVKKFIEALNAEIEVQSCEGEGTAITVTIPHHDQTISHR
ncbi:MAG: sensor histidine kinase [bacterium]|nr:sensor histidine kinase [bacterium]